MSDPSAAKEALFNAVFDSADSTPLEPLLKGGVDLKSPLKWGGAPLHVAARYGTEETVKLLLAYGADVNQDSKGTPLLWAADQGRLDMVELLLRSGADANQVPLDELGRSHFKPKALNPDWSAIKRRIVEARKLRPTLRFPKPLQEALATYPEPKRKAFQEWFRQRFLPTYLLTTKRASKDPQRPSALGRLFGAKPARPVLPVEASKFGGQPYLESADDWPTSDSKRMTYLGQINFGDLPSHVPEAPKEGLLVLFLEWTLQRRWTPGVRWYPKPDPKKAIQVDLTPSFAKYEASIEFVPSWDISSSDAWEKVLGEKSDEVDEAIDEWSQQFADARGYTDGSHELFAQASSMLHEALNVPEVTDIITLARFSFDNEAGFAWGTNTLYFLIGERDLREGRLDHVMFEMLNA